MARAKKKSSGERIVGSDASDEIVADESTLMPTSDIIGDDTSAAQGSSAEPVDRAAQAPSEDSSIATTAEQFWDGAAATPGAVSSIAVSAQVDAGIAKMGAWATKYGLQSDPYVSGLLAAVNERQDLSAWAAMSPFDLLPHGRLRMGTGIRRVARFVHFARNVLVFVPIAVTWRGIREATLKFGEYANQLPANAEANFLKFWQDGGDGVLKKGTELAQWARIQDIAAVDASLIILIIVLTVLGGGLSALASRRSSDAERYLESERTGIAIGVKRALHGKREATAESISQSLGESLNDLLNAARMVNVASLRMEAMSVGVESIGPRLDALGGRMSDLNSRLGADLQRAIDSLTTSVSRLGGTVDSDLAQTLSQVLTGLDEIRDQLGKTSASVEFGTKNLRDDLDAIHGQLTGVVRGRGY